MVSKPDIIQLRLSAKQCKATVTLNIKRMKLVSLRLVCLQKVAPRLMVACEALGWMTAVSWEPGFSVLPRDCVGGSIPKPTLAWCTWCECYHSIFTQQE